MNMTRLYRTGASLQQGCAAFVRRLARAGDRLRPIDRPAMAAPDGMLTRLRRNEAGNTIAIVAAALIPLAAMVGGAVDISRAYLVKTRLTQACDAGVLAGRKLMGSGGSVTSAVTTEVQKFVDFNFPPNYLGTSTLTVTPTEGANDQVVLTLTTDMPTVVMRIFNKRTMTITTTCNARNDYANIDIVLVLDTTGSMACKPERDSDSCSDWINDRRNPRSGQTTTINGKTVTYVEEETENSNGTGDNISRMQGLRDALTTLQTQIAAIETDFNTAAVGSRKRVRWAIVPFSQMVNAGFSQGSAGTTLYSRHNDWFNTTGNYKRVTTPGNSYSVSNRTGITHDATWLANTWDGCIEERQTSNSITPTSNHAIPSNLPSTAYDLMFDTAATTTGTRWTVADPSQIGESQYACPKAMRELQTMTDTTFNDYFAASTGFLPNGGTYLDIGLLWAARLLSRTGLWSADNPTTYNTFPVSRYVILMTDGQMDTGNVGYGAYAQEKWWMRVTNDGDADTSNDNHSQRMQMTCTAIKNMDVKIFVVSFGSGSTLNADMTGCSSGTGFAQRATDSDGLAQVFANIGQNIGSLRLSQ